MGKPNIWVIDIENSPNLAFVWGIWEQNVNLDALMESQHVMCFAAKRHGEKKTEFWSEYEHGEEAMFQRAYEILDEADVVVGYNSRRFDVPHLNREFLLRGYDPYSPIKHVDLLTVVRQQFKFASTKLDYVAQQLGVGRKTKHTGFQLWLDCMAEDPAAWKLMEKYNRQDVNITDKVYERLLGWITTHPDLSSYEGLEEGCKNCQSTHLQRRGPVPGKRAKTRDYWRFQCVDCGAWTQGSLPKDGDGPLTVLKAV
jgi:predicted PolB exonuclease-like 3'-5' exonuclease